MKSSFKCYTRDIGIEMGITDAIIHQKSANWDAKIKERASKPENGHALNSFRESRASRRIGRNDKREKPKIKEINISADLQCTFPDGRRAHFF